MWVFFSCKPVLKEPIVREFWIFVCKCHRQPYMCFQSLVLDSFCRQTAHLICLLGIVPCGIFEEVDCHHKSDRVASCCLSKQGDLHQCKILLLFFFQWSFRQVFAINVLIWTHFLLLPLKKSELYSFTIVLTIYLSQTYASCLTNFLLSLSLVVACTSSFRSVFLLY